MRPSFSLGVNTRVHFTPAVDKIYHYCNTQTQKKRTFLFNLRTRENKAYKLTVGSENFLAYCVMNNVGMGPCTGGGWTLVMKTNGTKVIY